MRISPFFGWMIFFSIIISIIIGASYIPDNFSRHIILYLFIIFIIFFSFFFCEELSEIFTFKYKIIESEGIFGNKRYNAMVLKLCWIIPLWEPVEKEYHSYKTQNVFGAKYREYYSTEKTFDSKKDVLKAIEKHKISVKDKRKEFFKRPEKENSKTTYIK